MPYEHIKMKGMHCLKFLLQGNDFLCKIHLKDAYFLVPQHKSSRKFVRFLWPGNLHEFVCLAFVWDLPQWSSQNWWRFQSHYYGESTYFWWYIWTIFFSWKGTRGIIYGQRYINIRSSEFGICNQLEKVSSRTIPKLWG